MKAKEIKLLGRTMKMAYSMKTACLYERLTGRNALDLGNEFMEGQGVLENILTLGWCIIATSNPEEEVMKQDDLLGEMDMEEATELIVKTKECLREFFKLEDGEKAQESGEESQEGND